MTAPRKIDPIVGVFFGAVLLAFVPPLLFALFEIVGVIGVSIAWAAFLALSLTGYAWWRRHIRATSPAAAILTASLGLTAQNDRVLAGTVDGMPVQVIWTPSQTRIDVRVGKASVLELDEWFERLSADQRVSMFEAIADDEMEVEGGELQVKTALSFRVVEHGAELEFRVRDAVRIAKTLSLAGPPPKGCVARLRQERKSAATPGTLSIASPSAAEGAVSVAAGEGNVSLANAKKQTS